MDWVREVYAWLQVGNNLEITKTAGAFIAASCGAVVFLWDRYQKRKEERRGVVVIPPMPTPTRPASERPYNRPARPIRSAANGVPIIPTIAISVVVIGAVYGIVSYSKIEKPPTVGYVCRSENGERCPVGSTVVGCGDPTPVIENVRKSCRNLNVRQIMNSDGGQCGHSAWELTCTPK